MRSNYSARGIWCVRASHFRGRLVSRIVPAPSPGRRVLELDQIVLIVSVAYHGFQDNPRAQVLVGVHSGC